MKSIHKLVVKEIVPIFFIALAVLTFLGFSRELPRFSELLIQSGSDPATLLLTLFTVTVNLLALTWPISFLIAVIGGFSRLAADSEITALRACGVGAGAMLRPVLVLATGAVSLSLLLSTIVAPVANDRLYAVRLELAMTQLTSEIRPGVFHEKFANLALYVADIDRSSSIWHGILLIQNLGPAEKRVFLAQRGRVSLSPDNSMIQLHMEDGLSYSTRGIGPESDSLTYFGLLDLPLQRNDTASSDSRPKPNRAKSMAELRTEILSDRHLPGSDPAVALRVEYHQRIALPFVCLVFAMLGVPLGLLNRQGGRSAGFLISLVVVFLYYLVFVYSWKASAYFGLMPVGASVWVANLLFTGLAIGGLRWANNGSPVFHPGSGFNRLSMAAHAWSRPIRQRSRRFLPPGLLSQSGRPTRAGGILDTYILHLYLNVLGLTLATTLALFTIFNLFELIDDVFQHDIAWSTVALYFLYIWPAVLVHALPLCILLSLLITFGVLEKSSQVTAFKASGVSVYRLAAPLALLITLLAVGVFVIQETILPETNQRQDSLYQAIRGRVVQTHFRPDATWLLGTDGRVYNFSYFDPERAAFADLSVYRLDLGQARILERITAPRVSWDTGIGKWLFLGGWRRSFVDQSSTSQRFDILASDQVDPPGHFRLEAKRSDKMSFRELQAYVKRLRQQGVDTLKLEVDLFAKLANPLICLVMVLIGLPFSMHMGKRGALYGMAASIAIGITYFALFNIFNAMGGHGLLPPFLAAWAPNVFFASTGFHLLLKMRT